MINRHECKYLSKCPDFDYENLLCVTYGGRLDEGDGDYAPCCKKIRANSKCSRLLIHFPTRILQGLSRKIAEEILKVEGIEED